MTIKLDELERLAKAATSGLPGDRIPFALRVMDPEGILALIAEVRALREALNTPQYTHIQHTEWSGSSVLGAIEPKVAEESFMYGALHITVCYGEKRVYTNMAAFCAAHPRESK